MHHATTYRKTVIGLALSLGVLIQGARAGIPVADALNLTQNIANVLAVIDQYVRQGEQYRRQLESLRLQYQEVESWTTADYRWENVQDILDNLADITNKIDYFDNSVRDINGYLEKFQDIAYYEKSPCFTAQGCSDAEREIMEKNKRDASNSQEQANKSMFEMIQAQKDSLRNDARSLEQERLRASTAKEQKAILAHANHFALEQNKQLMQIRALLVAQQEAVSADILQKSDEEAKQRAAHKLSTEQRITRTANPLNLLEISK